ncbi:hypothetical protein ACFVH6_07300 [Spirillospora sp. NPDC127200]
MTEFVACGLGVPILIVTGVKVHLGFAQDDAEQLICSRAPGQGGCGFGAPAVVGQVSFTSSGQ